MTAFISAPATILALSAVLLVGCGKKQDKPKPPPDPSHVDVVVLHAAPVTLITELPGRLSPHRVAEIRPQVNGVILKRLFNEGDTVKAGQQLYQIDPKPYEASLASAKATLAGARATVTAAEQTVKRYKPLAQAFAVSRQDLDNAISTLGQDQANVGSGQASVQTAAINLAYTRMYAPISGRTGRSSVTEGALVTANQTASLVTVTELDPIYVDVTEDSATVLRLKRELAAGKLKRAGNNAAEVTLVMDDGSKYEHPGRLLFSEVSVDQSTGSVTLRALFPNAEGLLLPGMFVREQIEEGVRQDGLLVPQRGITHNQRGDAVAIVVGQDNKVAQRTVVTDRAIGNDWLVNKGLADGDQVLVDGLQSVHPGDTVVPRPVAVDGSDVKPVGNGQAASTPVPPPAR
ncbi:MAG: efflux RND transporter periplasmic adaptor subunit [Janthinobacterium lividum]